MDKKTKDEIKGLRKRSKAIEKEVDNLYKEQSNIMNKIMNLNRENIKETVSKKFHVGDYFVLNEGLVSYHCDPIQVFEILEVNIEKYISVKARIFSIHYSDGDYTSKIEKGKVDESKYTKLRKINKDDYLELKELIFNPELYETSKWNVTKK